jgi:hypothetical protein
VSAVKKKFYYSHTKRSYIDRGHSTASLVIGQVCALRRVNVAIGIQVSFLTQRMAVRCMLVDFALVIFIESKADVIGTTSVSDNKFVTRGALAAI